MWRTYARFLREVIAPGPADGFAPARIAVSAVRSVRDLFEIHSRPLRISELLLTEFDSEVDRTGKTNVCLRANDAVMLSAIRVDAASCCVASGPASGHPSPPTRRL